MTQFISQFIFFQGAFTSSTSKSSIFRKSKVYLANVKLIIKNQNQSYACWVGLTEKVIVFYGLPSVSVADYLA